MIASNGFAIRSTLMIKSKTVERMRLIIRSSVSGRTLRKPFKKSFISKEPANENDLKQVVDYLDVHIDVLPTT